MQLEPARTFTGRMQRMKRAAAGVKAVEQPRSECSMKNQINAFTLEHPTAERGGDRAPLPESQSNRKVIIELGSYQDACKLVT